MKETFLIKHAVGGRTFIDSGKQPVRYDIQKEGEGWTFAVTAPEDSAMEELLKWKDELNVFVFQEFDDQPTRKIWYYVKEGSVRFAAESGQLVFAADSRIEYVPDRFSGNF